MRPIAQVPPESDCDQAWLSDCIRMTSRAELRVLAGAPFFFLAEIGLGEAIGRVARVAGGPSEWPRNVRCARSCSGSSFRVGQGPI